MAKIKLTQKNIRYTILTFFLILFSIFSMRHFILGGGAAASIDALCPFGGFETLLTFISTGGFVPRILISSLVLGIGLLITVIFFKKGFCGYICPFGTVQEFIGKITKKKYTLPENVDKYARYLKYIILAAILIGTAYTGTLVFRNYDPFMTFFHFGKGIFWDYAPDEFAEQIIPFVILIVILFLSIFIERFFCKYLCPLGATMNIFAKLGFTKLVRDNKSCNSCGLCDKKCPMGVKISNVDEIKDVECINCNECVTDCHKNSLSLKIFGKKISTIMYIGLVIATFFVVIIAAKGTGIWQSVPNTSLVNLDGELDGANIKGWMTLQQVSTESKIHLSHFIYDLNLPADIDPNIPLKDISNKYRIEFETQKIRDYVSNFEHSHEVEEENCPWNIKNEPYPGKCGFYEDKDGNKICDLSE